MATPPSTLSLRGSRAIQPALPYFEKFFRGAASVFDAESNPGGYVLLAVAENKLNVEPLLSKLKASRDVVDASTLGYTNMCGKDTLRSAFASMISRTVLPADIRIHPDQLVISSGCGALLYQLSVLLCDPGDGILLPTPTYAALYNDMGTLAYGHIVDVPTEADGLRLTREALEAGVARSLASGHAPRVLLLLHPNNPLGTVYSVEELKMAADFARSHALHLIVDEIYVNSVYGGGGEGGRFVSAVEALHDGSATSAGGALPSFLGTHTHVLWGMSKDWGMSGLRVGVLYTHNTELLTALGNVNYFTSVSNDTQDCVAAMLSDAEWVDAYLGSTRALLRGSYEAAT